MPKRDGQVLDTRRTAASPVLIWSRSTGATLSIRVALFFSSSGRTGPARAAVVTMLFVLAAWLAQQALHRGNSIVYALTGILFGAVLARCLAEWSRRLHDTGHSGYVGAGAMVALLIVLTAVGVSDLGFRMPALYQALLVLTALVAAALLLWPGQKQANTFGEPPTMFGGTPGPAPMVRRGIAWAIVSITGCLLIGLLLNSISTGMRERNEETVRALERQQAGGRP